MYSNIHSRAGLIVLAFILIISLVSAAPIPTTSTLSPRNSHLVARNELESRMSEQEKENLEEHAMNAAWDTFDVIGDMVADAQPGIH